MTNRTYAHQRYIARDYYAHMWPRRDWDSQQWINAMCHARAWRIVGRADYAAEWLNEAAYHRSHIK